MQIEQPAQLNKHVDTSIPLTWAVRWQALKPSLPLLICCSLLFVEHLAFRCWLHDRSLLSAFPLFFVCALVPIFLGMLGFEVQVRVGHRSKRTLRLEPKRVCIRPAKCNRIPWNHIAAWRLEPLANVTGLSKMTLEYSPGRKSKLRREWSMVLQEPDQEHALLSELEHLRQTGLNAAEVIQSAEPSPPKAPGRRLRGMIPFALGFWCLVHGLPLLGVSLLPADRPPDQAQSTSNLTSKERAKLQRFVARYFSSFEQLRKFILVTGGGVTALGGASYFWALFSLKRSGQVTHQSAGPSARAATEGENAGNRIAGT